MNLLSENCVGSFSFDGVFFFLFPDGFSDVVFVFKNGGSMSWHDDLVR